MKAISKLTNLFLIGILFSLFLSFPFDTIFAQSAFNRNDNYDFSGNHALTAGGTDPDNFNIFIESDSDFRRFKLYILKEKLNLQGRYFANKYRVDMNNDGTWEQDWAYASPATVSYYYPNPANGISSTQTIKVEIEYSDIQGNFIYRTKYKQITIFSTPRVYANAENNSFVQLRDEECTNKIPVLMVEGFDPLNEKFPEAYYNLTWDLVNYDLYPNGYEVFILNFFDGGRDLRLNADVLLKAIEKVHEICPNYNIAVAGLSMGGPIARYALAKKESQGGVHNIGFFLSYDSPQTEAHVSPDLQDWIKIQDPNMGAIGAMQNNLKSVAAKQMLGYNTYDPTRITHREFYNELNALNGDGYPHKSYNAAVSNGNMQATWGYSSVGRHLMTLKINDNLIKDVPAVQLDCGTGSMITDITSKRYGDIFPNPFISIYYELQIIFNPAYIPTWSSLDLVNAIVDNITGNISSYDRSKFDDFVVQTTPLQHHQLSTVTRNKIMYWLNQDFNIAVNYNFPEGGSTSADNYPVNILYPISITVPSKNISVNGRQINYNFTKWEDGDRNNPRTFFTSHNIAHTATMKGSLVSNNSNTFSTNSQRKITRTSSGNLFLTYESMGHIWYEMSTDNGSTWILGNGGKPLDANGGKLPSIDSHGNDFGIVWQENDGGSTKIQIACGGGSNLYNGYPKNIFWDITQSYSNDLNPTIAYDYNGRAIAVWENKTNYVYQAGIIARFGPLSQLSFLGSPTWDGWNTQVIPGTNSSSVTPTIAANKIPTDIYNIKYNIAWTQGSSIQYSGIIVNSSNVMNISSAQTISTGGLPYNKMPSVVTVPDGTARFAWIGQYYPGSNSVVVFKSSNNSTFWYFGSNIRTPQIAIADDNSGYYIMWNEVSDNSTKFTDSQTLSTIYNLNTTGQAVQLSNGTNKNSMYALVYNNQSVPYYFKVSPTIGSRYGLQKTTTAKNLSVGRGGVVLKDNVGYYFILKDISVDKNRVDFVDASDTLDINGINELNKCLLSQAFTLKDNSIFNYKINYGVTDTSAKKSLKGTDYIKFGLELIDASNNITIGNLEGFEFNSKQFSDYEEKPFKINHSTVGNNKEVYLRITASTNFNGKYILTKSYSDLSADLPKESVIEANFNEIGAIKEYSLDQNYPNPFNPTTQINYQILQDGKVTLKVYDILGKSVSTLVDENKVAGKYSAIFDGSSLPSGLYIYEIRINNIVSSHKMLLIK